MTPVADLSQPAQPPQNPLVALTVALEQFYGTQQEMAAALAAIAVNTAPPQSHHYALHQVDQTAWLVYCYACSEQASQLVYPCALPGATLNAPPPPSGISINPPAQEG